MLRSVRTADAELRQLLRLVDEAFSAHAWHGPTLWASIRGLESGRAAWRPAPNRHNIWELVVHAAYWKHVVRRRLTGRVGRRFPLRGTNWFERPSGPRTWRADVQLLAEEHEELRRVVAELEPGALERPVHGKRDTTAYTIRGIAAHDLYHAGQIQLLKALGSVRISGS